MSAYTIAVCDFDNAAHQRGLVACIDAYARDEMGGGKGLRDDVKAALVPGLRAHPACLIRLALLGDEIVGAAVCFFGYSTFSAKPRLNVHDLAVMPAHRDQGVGRLLLASVVTAAQEAGCVSVTLEVRHDNPRARHLYQSLGFGDGFSPMDFWEKKLV